MIERGFGAGLNGTSSGQFRMAGEKTDETATEFQRQTRELLKAQQDAYLAAVKAWREQAAQGIQLPPWPEMSAMEAMPKPSEIADVYYTFAAKLLADQSRFMEALSQAMAPPKEKK